MIALLRLVIAQDWPNWPTGTSNKYTKTYHRRAPLMRVHHTRLLIFLTTTNPPWSPFDWVIFIDVQGLRLHLRFQTGDFIIRIV